MRNYKIVTLTTEGSLLGNVAVIQGNNKVHSGKITYLEGEVFEVEFPQARFYAPGEAVKTIIYTPEGMVYFDTSVIAQGNNEIILLFPPDISSSLIRNRQSPRIQIPLEGEVHSIRGPTIKGFLKNEQLSNMKIHNISQGGAGFAYSNPISLNSVISFTIQLDAPLLCHAKVIHTNQLEEQIYFYGCSFMDFNANDKVALRSWILRKQIHQRFEAKRAEIDAVLLDENQNGNEGSK